MAELVVGASQSTLLFLRPGPRTLQSSDPSSRHSHAAPKRYSLIGFPSSGPGHSKLRVVSSDSKIPTLTTLDSSKEGIDVEPLSGGGDEGGGGNRFGDGGRGGGGDGGGDSGKGEDGGEGEGESKKERMMLMSQKFTLAYAGLVGVGGLMGFLKSGSQKSLVSGGLSAALLYYVYTELPTRPVLASSLGLGLSASLLVVMGSRYKKSKKIFPAGVVSLVSLIMTGGYLHGIMRTMH